MYTAEQARHDMEQFNSGKRLPRIERWLELIQDMANFGKSHTFLHAFKANTDPAYITTDELNTLKSLGYVIEHDAKRNAFKVTWVK
jgi:hypothetical protein